SLLSADGTVTTLSDVPRNATYSLSVYDPSPNVRQLTSVGKRFPQAIRDDTVIGNVTIPAWPRHLQKGVHPLSRPFMVASDRAWRASGADSADNEYEAAVALEHYYRQPPFRYSLNPRL